jgi:hypothetical protein
MNQSEDIIPGRSGSPRMSAKNHRSNKRASFRETNFYNNFESVGADRSDDEISVSNFNSSISSFFQAHRPVKLAPGERVFVLRRVPTNNQAHKDDLESFTFDCFKSEREKSTSQINQQTPEFQFTAGIIEEVEKRLCNGTILTPVERGKYMTIKCHVRCVRGNDIYLDHEQNKEVLISGCNSMNSGMKENIKWLSENEFEFRAEADVDLNKEDIVELLLLNGATNKQELSKKDLFELRNQLFNKLKEFEEFDDEKDEDEDDEEKKNGKNGKKGKKGGKKFNYGEKKNRNKEHVITKHLVKRAATNVKGVPKLNSSRSIRISLVDKNAVTVAYDDDHKSNHSSVMTNENGIHVHVHHRSEVVPLPMPSASLGERAGQFLHENGGDDDDFADLITEQYREGFPTYGRILIRDGNTIITRCEAEAHLNRNTGLTAPQMQIVARNIRLSELKVACGLLGKNNSQERVKQYSLDCMALFAAAERNSEGRIGSLASDDLFFNIWAEYPLTLLREKYADTWSSSGRSNVDGRSGEDSSSSWLVIKAIIDKLYSATTSIASIFNCYRRESSSPLWNDRLNDLVPRPVRLAPAGAQIRCTSWHPIRHRLAIASSDGSVFVHIPQLDDEEDG